LRKRNKTNRGRNPLTPPEEVVIGFKNRLKPRSINQKDYIRTVAENTVSFCQGVPGSGKTHIAVGMALEYLLDFKVKKIVITRPVVEAGEKLGFLPGTAEEKLHPYLLPLFDEIDYFLKPQHFNKLKSSRQIEIVPLGLMRGRSFHEAFIVADECQNASYEQLKMLLTRIGIDSKMVLTGDLEQSDLQENRRNGFYDIIQRLQGVHNIGFSHLEVSDIVRNPIIADMVDRL
jgi:phosphate starvation-inducible PhoH-like protein